MCKIIINSRLRYSIIYANRDGEFWHKFANRDGEFWHKFIFIKRLKNRVNFYFHSILVQMGLNFCSSFLTPSGFSKFRIFVPTLSGGIFYSIIYYYSTSIILLFSSSFSYFSFILSIYSVYLYI